MNDPDLAVRFTDDVYATRREVIEKLHTSLIDHIWRDDILPYRARFAKRLSIYDVSKTAASITFTRNVANRLNTVQARLNKATLACGRLSDDSIELYTLRRLMETTILKSIAKKNDLTVDDIVLENILEGRPVSEEFTILARYHKCLKRLIARPNEPLDKERLVVFYSLLLDKAELGTFYRTQDLSSRVQKYVIGREYEFAPTGTIEPLMNNLFGYVSLNAADDCLITAIVTFYQMNYIKPFEACNEEMAVLFMKAILAQQACGPIAAYLPLESLIAEHEAEVHARSRESQRSRDLTYVLITILDLFDKIVTKFLDEITLSKAETARNAYIGGTDPKAFEEEFGVSQEKIMPFKAPVEAKEPEPPAASTMVKAVAPVDQLPLAAPKKEEAQPKREEMPPKAAAAVPPQVPLSVPVNDLHEEISDEKALRRAEEDLLETDPVLRPHMAHFYVRHRTLGRYYTIQQYKKAERTVYETARTAMDTLARRGYYRRESVKNKFVYTPIMKK